MAASPFVWQNMVILTAWSIGRLMASVSCLLQPGKVEKQDSINSIPYQQAEEQTKNFLLPMLNMALILPMENKLQLHSVRRWVATGNAIGADGRLTFIYSIFKRWLMKIFPQKKMSAKNFRCGMITPFIFFRTAGLNWEWTCGNMILPQKSLTRSQSSWTTMFTILHRDPTILYSKREENYISIIIHRKNKKKSGLIS